MSTHTMPEHGVIAYTCDHIGQPGRRVGCRAGETVRPDQGGLWLDPFTTIPTGWTRSGSGHLCPDHPTGPVASLTFSSTSAMPTKRGAS